MKPNKIKWNNMNLTASLLVPNRISMGSRSVELLVVSWGTPPLVVTLFRPIGGSGGTVRASIFPLIPNFALARAQDVKRSVKFSTKLEYPV